MGPVIRFFAAGAAALSLGALAEPQQIQDPNFDTRVGRPALASEHPAMLFDEAHNNVHRTDTTYRAFAEIVRNDGVRLRVARSRLSPASLKPYRLLVIAGPLGGPLDDNKKAARPAFTPREIEAVRRWVSRGGGLLLLTDHEPVASASAALVSAFGLTPSKTVILDRKNRLENMYPTNVLATVENGLLRDGPISCSVKRVLVFGGQTFTAPRRSIVIGVGGSARLENGDHPAGNSQLAAFSYGKGRIVVTGDMGMMSAQLMVDGEQKTPWGMNWPGIDNRQLLLNSVRWLAGHEPCAKRTRRRR